MAIRIVKELAVVVSTYEDRSSGATKNRYENIGALAESTNDRGETNRFLMIKRSFNPAGVPFKPGSDRIMVSMFDPKPRDGQASGQPASGGAPAGGNSHTDIDDEIPF